MFPLDSTAFNCTAGSVRLVGGADQYSGSVEVCIHGHWGAACDDEWGRPEAQVVCNQLGFPESLENGKWLVSSLRLSTSEGRKGNGRMIKHPQLASIAQKTG